MDKIGDPEAEKPGSVKSVGGGRVEHSSLIPYKYTPMLQVCKNKLICFMAATHYTMRPVMAEFLVAPLARCEALLK